MITPERLDEIEENKFRGAAVHYIDELLTAVRAYQKLLSEGVRVYQTADQEYESDWSVFKSDDASHTGLLVQIEKIEG